LWQQFTGRRSTDAFFAASSLFVPDKVKQVSSLVKKQNGICPPPITPLWYFRRFVPGH
jgi:hypothetical protein